MAGARKELETRTLAGRFLAPAVRGAALVLAFAACGPASGQTHPRVRIHTDLGDVTVEVLADKAPVTAANFLRYVDEGRYAGAAFYRIRKDPAVPFQGTTGIVQGGQWYGDSTRLLPPIPLESTRKTGLKHVDGAVSMARFGPPNSARSEFFVVLGDQPYLDWRDETPDGQGYAVFGRVEDGMDVVRRIQGLPAEGERLRTPVRILSITRMR
jgi:peptidyl-prolyl cis-trans isomerase A (cyclophilin A)